MTMTDPVADMITRIRNGYRAKLYQVSFPASKLKESIIKVMQEEGFVDSYEYDAESKSIAVNLKYVMGEPSLSEIKRVSKPGRRVYSGTPEKGYRNGLGVIIISTPKGVMSGQSAKEHNVGGEVICELF